MLIKTWCYYESRILGAHYGLISTYALETLVLYVFHMYGAFLTTPLMVISRRFIRFKTTIYIIPTLLTFSLIFAYFQVLYRFLDYYSNFDWDNYCISLDGAVTKAFLPNIVGKKRTVVDEVSRVTRRYSLHQKNLALQNAKSI